MDITVLLQENDKECDFMRYVGYFEQRSRIPKIKIESFFLQREINKKLYNIYTIIETDRNKDFGTNYPLETYTPVIFNEGDKITWHFAFKEHSEQQKLLHHIGCTWRTGFITEPGILEEVVVIQKQLNKIYDEVKMENLLNLNNEEIGLMHFAGYKYRTIEMDNPILLSNTLFFQLELNDDIQDLLVDLIIDNDFRIDRKKVETDYWHKDIAEYRQRRITWENVFEQHHAKQTILEKIASKWNLRNITIDNMKLEDILKKQTYLIEMLQCVKKDLIDVYREMFKYD